MLGNFGGYFARFVSMRQYLSIKGEIAFEDVIKRRGHHARLPRNGIGAAWGGFGRLFSFQLVTRSDYARFIAKFVSVPVTHDHLNLWHR